MPFQENQSLYPSATNIMEQYSQQIYIPPLPTFVHRKVHNLPPSATVWPVSSSVRWPPSQDWSAQVAQAKEHQRTPNPRLSEANARLAKLEAAMHNLSAEMRDNSEKIIESIQAMTKGIEDREKDILNHVHASKASMPQMAQALLSDIERTFTLALASISNTTQSENGVDRGWLLNQFEEISRRIIANSNATEQSVIPSSSTEFNHNQSYVEQARGHSDHHAKSKNQAQGNEYIWTEKPNGRGKHRKHSKGHGLEHQWVIRERSISGVRWNLLWRLQEASAGVIKQVGKEWEIFGPCISYLKGLFMMQAAERSWCMQAGDEARVLLEFVCQISSLKLRERHDH